MSGTRTHEADRVHGPGRGAGADDHDVGSAEFMNRFGLGGGTDRSARLTHGLNRIAVRIAPYADPFATQLLSDLAVWVFAFDDLCDEDLPSLTPTEMLTMVARLQRTIEAPEVPLDADPFALALRDIRLRVDAMATPVQVRRWVDAMRGYFLAEARIGADTTARGEPQDVSDYLLTRLHSGAALAVPVLLDAVGAALPAPRWEDRRIRALTEMAAGIVVVDTDIHSFAKESERGSRSGNLVALLEAQRGRGLGPGQGLEAASVLRNAIMRRFTDLGRQTAMAPADPRIQRFLDALTQYVHGVRDWCGATSRYHPYQPNGSHHQPGRAATALRPPEGVPLTPPPIASIAWWWAVDGAPPPAP
ncbi:terpene synthase family protein [Streptomyces sp. NBC_00335]|uniref:terpene synthase family protein n=1 Tax=unclassified Streptomyces TaxID=2593676 RepID=UPI00224EBC65|nr:MULTISPECIES: terpene synthase family protein [unclassified Streptomyces]MCX5402512.1 terpene synthase family protein [Streptomyces sp. NBC_00086]